VSVTIEDGTVWRTVDGQRQEVGIVYPTTLGWQSMRAGWFVSRHCRTRRAAVRALLADQGIGPDEAPR
jgi:hypothetical protein